MFKKFRDRTGIKVLVITRMGTNKTVNIHDTGNGPFLYGFRDDIQYLKKDGTFRDFDTGSGECRLNGDYVSWRQHIGDVRSLDWEALKSPLLN